MSETVMERPKPTTIGDPKPRPRTKRSTRHYVDLVNKYGDFHFVTHNHVKDIDPSGTSLVGYLEDTSFYRLIEMFGRPGTDNHDDYKCDAQWDIEFDDGSVATIYNWKNGLNYIGKIDKDGNHGLQLTDITYWNVGGKDPKVLDRIMTMLEMK